MKLRKKAIMLIIVVMMIFSISIKTKAVSPSSKIRYQGIDVSNWQGYINYDKVKNNGIDIVYIKASQGTNYKDPYFEMNYENAKKYGLKVGVYHFLTARNNEDAIKEAEFFASIISGKRIDCKLAMDFEELGDLNPEEVNSISKAFLKRLEEITQKETIVYSDLYNSQKVFKLSKEYPLWIAYYGEYRGLENIQTDWLQWQGQQYTDVGIVNGISGDVDKDYFTEDILLKDTSEISKFTAPKEKNKSEKIVHHVKKGDTLWTISKNYDTTIDEIVKLNKITNQNLIYIEQELTIVTNTNFDKINATGKIFYTVKSGDTLSELAIRFETTIEKIIGFNNITNPDLIYVDQRLRI